MTAVKAPTTLLLAGILACASNPRVSFPTTEVGLRLLSDLSYLAGPALRGRLTGTPGNDSAAAFIARRYATLGLQPAFQDSSCHSRPTCAPSFLQPFRLGLLALDRLDVPVRSVTQNVAAIMPGSDEEVRREYVIIGAHYDHIGASNAYARDASAFGMMHLGADDNGSGSVAVLELARRFSQHPARRSVVFVNFGAEELGLIGSRVFVENSPIPMSDVITMVNLDMVGRLRGNFLILYSNAAGRFRQVVDSVERIPPAMDFRVSWKSATAETSDQISFADAHIPVFGAFTDFHADYHRAGDIVSRINFAGLEKVIDLTERVIRAVADGNTRPN